MDAAPFCATTREILQSDASPLFKKPRLTDALLRRPPFRFLHDIVTAVQKKTGFAQDVFSDSELDSKALAEDKEAKIEFLRKLIHAVETASGTAVDVDPLKIVAGLEPERTNTLLQALGRVAREGVENAPVMEPLPVETETPRRAALSRPPSRRGAEDIQSADALEPAVEVLRISDAEDDCFVEAPDVWKCDTREEELLVEDVPLEGALEISRESSRVGPRPQSAKKAPPSGRQRQLQTPRRPPSSRGIRSRPSSSARNRESFAEERQKTPDVGLLSSDSEIEFVEPRREPSPPMSSHGALVRELQGETASDEQASPSFLLARRPSSTTDPSSVEVTLAPLLESFRSFAHLSSSLEHCLENLGSALEPMQKELAFWEREACSYSTQLREAESVPSLHPQTQTLQELQDEIADRQQRIRALKYSTENNDAVIMRMLRSLTEDEIARNEFFNASH